MIAFSLTVEAVERVTRTQVKTVVSLTITADKHNITITRPFRLRAGRVRHGGALRQRDTTKPSAYPATGEPSGERN